VRLVPSTDLGIAANADLFAVSSGDLDDLVDALVDS
jgi:hypothetical protein